MEESVWTQFWDMHSGGYLKEPPYNQIYIEAEPNEARVIFYNRFGHSPDRVTCTCCGTDYAVDSGTLQQVTGYHRGCAYGDDGYIEKPDGKYAFTPYRTVEEFLEEPEVLFIFKEDVLTQEKAGEVPIQRYVWLD